jgi:outer membrane protein assembly factor BamB
MVPSEEAETTSTQDVPVDQVDPLTPKPTSQGLLPMFQVAEIVPAEYPKLPVVFHEGILLLISEGGVVEAFAVESGELIWKLGLPGKDLHPPGITPAGLLFAARDGSILIVESATGNILEEKQSPSPIELRPVIEGDVAYFATSVGLVVAYDYVAGLELWRTETKEPVQALSLGGELLVVSGSGGTLTAIDLPSGEIKWRFLGSGTFEAPASFGLEGERIYIGDSAGVFYCLNAQKGKQHFKWETGAAVFGPPLVDRDRVFVATYGNTLYCYRRNNGHLLWRTDLPGRPASGPLRVNARLVVLIQDGLVLELNPSAQGRQAQAPYRIGSEIRSLPSIEPPYAAWPLRNGHVLLMKTGQPPLPAPTLPPPPTQQPGPFEDTFVP